MENNRDSANAGNKTTVKPTLKQRILALLKLNNTAHEIALGVAIGVFIAITPLYGLHTIMVIIAALLIKRVNKLAILLGTNISTVITFPFITWTAYRIGNFILGDRYPSLHWFTFKFFNYKQLLAIYFPLFIGSVVLGAVLAVFFYFLTRWVIARGNVKIKVV